MPQIESPEEAQSVARLIQSGQLAGAGRDSALAALRDFDATGAAPADSAPAVPTPTEERKPYGVGDYLAAVPETAAHLASGIFALPAGAAASAYQLASAPAGLKAKRAAEASAAAQDMFTYEPRTQGGKDLTSVAEYLPKKLAETGDKAGMATADATGSGVAGGVVDTAIQSLPALLLHRAFTPARAGVAAADLTPAQAAVQKLAALGIKVTPEQAEAGFASRAAQSLTGSAKLEREVSKDNAPTVDEIAARHAGLAPGATVDTPGAFGRASQPHLAVYRQLRQVGYVPADTGLKAEVNAIDNPGGESFAGDVNPAIQKLKNYYSNLPGFDSNDAVSKIRQLRRDGYKRQGGQYDPEVQALGEAQVSVADALENQIERHLQRGAPPSAPPGQLALADVPADQRYVPSAEGPASQAPELGKRNTATPDATQDSILQFLAKHPRGLSSEEAAAQGIDPASFGGNAANVGIKRAFRKGGMSFDEAAQVLEEHGYPVTEGGDYSPNVLLEHIDSELRGQPVHSIANTRAALEADAAHAEQTAAQAAAPKSVTAEDVTALAQKASERAPDAVAKVMDSWGDDKPETLARVHGELQSIAQAPVRSWNAAGARNAPAANLVNEYRQARQGLAKIDSVRRSVKGGHVSAKRLYSQRAKLSGDLKQIAEGYEYVPRSLQTVADIKDGGPFSALDGVLGAGSLAGGLAAHLVGLPLSGPLGVGAAATTLARPLGRALLRSRSVQRRITGQGNRVLPPANLTVPELESSSQTNDPRQRLALALLAAQSQGATR